MSPRPQPIQILLVEDSPGDVNLTRRALEHSRIANDLHVVRDGEEAMDFLRQLAPHEEAPRPALVLLDLTLPKKSGREVLAEMKDDPSLRRIPVIVLTTSRDEADVLASYDLHANSFVSKPIDPRQFRATVAAIEDFWLTIGTLPDG